jgi:hypothetical protein
VSDSQVSFDDNICDLFVHWRVALFAHVCVLLLTVNLFSLSLQKKISRSLLKKRERVLRDPQAKINTTEVV